LRTRIQAKAVERRKTVYLEIYSNLQQGKTYFSLDVEKTCWAFA